MNYKNKNLEELGKKIDNLDNQNKELNIKKKESGAGFGFKISTEIIAALVWLELELDLLWIITLILNQ